MIEWKRVDKDKPPVGSYLFLFDGIVYEGWILCNPEEGLDMRDDDGFPLWESNENYLRRAHYVRWYAEINLPEREQ